MTGRPYDVVIVGGGVAGALVARVLAAAGKQVLMLEAGAAAGKDPGTYQSYVDSYLAAPSGVPNTGYPANPNAPSANVLQTGLPNDERYLQQDGALPFPSDYLRAVGGTTLHWMGTSLRMVPNDFHMRSVYGQGLDWPIGYEDLEPYYRSAEGSLGVAADVEDQRIHGVTFPDGYVFPMHRIPPTYLDQFFARRLKGLTVPLYGGDYEARAISIPQARNSTPNPAYAHGAGYDPVGAPADRIEGLRCQGNSSCIPICPVQAKYTALRTLNALPDRFVEIRTQTVASRLLIDSASGRISGVEYKRYADPGQPQHTTEIARGTVYVLAANAIENAKLLLLSGAANSSDQVGRNLMDHPYMFAWGLAPEPVYPYRGPDATSGLESLRDGRFREKHAGMRASFNNWAWSPFGSPAGDVSAALEQKLLGSKLRDYLWSTVTRQVRMGMLVEQLPDPSNRVTVNPHVVDPLGIPKPVVSYSIADYSLAGLAAARFVSARVFACAGVDDKTNYDSLTPTMGFQSVPYGGVTYKVMGSGHLVGTHRMGTARHESVVDRRLCSWDHRNLYLVGAGAMPTIGTSNPTLTAAALSIMAAEDIVRGLR